MAGHSKWKNIQHRKGAQDAKRGKIFTKIAKEITVAAKAGGGDPTSNAALRLILAKAKAANMPKDNIERAIKKGTGEGQGAEEYVEKVYEGYAPGGIAVLVECLTDNINRTVSTVRHAFTRYGGNLGTEGSVAYLFKKKGVLVYSKDKISDFDKLFEIAIEHGAEDVKEQEDAYEIFCEVGSFNELKEALDSICADPDVAEIAMIPDTTVELDEEKAQSIQKLIDLLEDCDDVQNVYHNAELPDAD